MMKINLDMHKVTEDSALCDPNLNEEILLWLISR